MWDNRINPLVCRFVKFTYTIRNEEITSLSYINKNYTAGDECEISIDTPPVGFTLKKGNRIRIDISSHSDLYVPHSNTLGHCAKVTETKIAKNIVICDENAYIILPIR